MTPPSYWPPKIDVLLLAFVFLTVTLVVQEAVSAEKDTTVVTIDKEEDDAAYFYRGHVEGQIWEYRIVPKELLDLNDARTQNAYRPDLEDKADPTTRVRSGLVRVENNIVFAVEPEDDQSVEIETEESIIDPESEIKPFKRIGTVELTPMRDAIRVQMRFGPASSVRGQAMMMVRSHPLDGVYVGTFVDYEDKGERSRFELRFVEE
ncbi:hypothetical protein [Calycomorphotria hydatis]|uniref:Uncharacterized protein n=1 Tax=Calycomorphotria hydatis TaxID=2528027 RepID=A0A517T664_9PLAN|nr:hypothetical protein [Calycomorphotria hydatis]QDT63848.1 hypothetical protein V22_10730 [Calycomorphotria hydatis]